MLGFPYSDHVICSPGIFPFVIFTNYAYTSMCMERRLYEIVGVMLHEPIHNDVFNATQRCNIVATLFRMVTTLFQHCNAVLR